MKCAFCNSKLIKTKGSVKFNTRSLGSISVPNLNFLECTTCGEKLLEPKESDKAVSFISDMEQELINKLPISEFLSANESALLLGISKQAFSKHPKKALIYSAKIGNKSYYHRKSVELLRTTGNGKFLLKKPEYNLILTKAIDDEPIGTQILQRRPKAYSTLTAVRPPSSTGESTYMSSESIN